MITFAIFLFCVLFSDCRKFSLCNSTVERRFLLPWWLLMEFPLPKRISCDDGGRGDTRAKRYFVFCDISIILLEWRGKHDKIHHGHTTSS